MLKIDFSPPDIREPEIEAVVEVLKSGWITTGLKMAEFEKQISRFCGTEATVCINSATAGLEQVLRFFGVGPGDEVITSAYTYSASASVIDHVGAKIVLCDTADQSFFMDYDALEGLINEKTKVIIPVDIGGVMADYDRIYEIVEKKKSFFTPHCREQENLGRVMILADAAHSIGSFYKGRSSGTCADFSCFSFHAVKNVTTAEGGAITWTSFPGLENDQIYRQLHLISNHGQSKTAEDKLRPGNWEYDIEVLGYKCNMTDMVAALGIAQLNSYPQRLKHRLELVRYYDSRLETDPEVVTTLHHLEPSHESSGHLYIVRLRGKDEAFRNQLIQCMAERGVATNVHYKPLPMMTAYQQLGFDIADFPNAYRQYHNAMTLPLHTKLSDEDATYIIDTFWSCYEQIAQATD